MAEGGSEEGRYSRGIETDSGNLVSQAARSLRLKCSSQGLFDTKIPLDLLAFGSLDC